MTMPAASDVITLADRLGARVAVAESLTGGLLASALIEVPGASRVVSGGIVAYDTSLKASLLGVSVELLSRVGPVDPEVARQMAAGVRRACAVSKALTGETRETRSSSQGDALVETSSVALPSDIGLATTGVAGPDPDPQTGVPAGTVWIGVSSRFGDRAVRMHLDGTRAEIRSAAVIAALGELAVELKRMRAACVEERPPGTAEEFLQRIRGDSSHTQE